MLVNVFWSYATTANGKEMYKSDMHVQKKPGCFAINPNLFLFAVLVAVGRCLVFVEPTSKIRFLAWKACQVSILIAQNGILFLGLHRICSKTSKTKSNIMTQLREVAQGLKMKML